MDVAKEFYNRWNYPACIGAIDGKHIRIVCPANSGSQYFNYKGFYSIVLMAVVNAKYDIIYMDIGAQGRVSDGGIWGHCSLKQHIDQGTLDIPEFCLLPNTNVEMPLHMVGDDAFPLCYTIMKPYAHRNLSHEEQIYNYRLSRARRIVENVFGILSTRFRVFHTAIYMRPDNVENVVKASAVLHNVLNSRSKNHYITPGLIDGEAVCTI